MESDTQPIEALKFILENSFSPENLDSHPWTRSLLAGQVDNSKASPGQCLIIAIANLFVESMPSIPPRHGKRLDTRWGEFGLLAAQYFAPILYGVPTPASLRDAWSRIDQSILLFVFKEPENQVDQLKKDTYKLISGESEVAPHSTLSDWHRKGLQRLLESMIAREAYLSQRNNKPALITANGKELHVLSSTMKRQSSHIKIWTRFATLVILLFLLGFFFFGSLKAYRVYEKALLLQQNATALRESLSSSDSRVEQIRQAGPAISAFRSGFIDLKGEVEPLLWVTPWLGWVPEYGGELAASQDLIEYADSLLGSIDIIFQAMNPLLEDDLKNLTLNKLVIFFETVRPELLVARLELDTAFAARARLHPERFSPEIRGMIINDVDPTVALLDDSIDLALEIHRVLGASSDGPKTYLLLAQNEDELRPTGGFITAAGTVLVQEGDVSDPVFRNSGYLDNWEKPYPAAPWQLSHYMNSPVLIFRDSTWFTNYPTTAEYAEQLYSYTSGHSVDGVIAFNQQFLVRLLEVTGPLEIPGNPPVLIGYGNVIDVIRKSKQPTPEDLTNPEWDNKHFLNEIAPILIDKLLSGQVDLEKLAEAMLASLDEKSLLLQVDNQVISDFLFKNGWDGSVQPKYYDFIMIADSNIGFNKTNAVVSTGLSYEVDLRNLLSPSSVLLVKHQNNANEMFTCSQWGKERIPGENDYPITDCYWNYMRVYRPAGTSLIDSVSQFVPANWMLNYHSVPPQIDELGNENIPGVQVYGTLKVIPGGHTETTIMRFNLPMSVVQMQVEDKLLSYKLRVQKQPGTSNTLLHIKVVLPAGVSIYRVPDAATIDDATITFDASLQKDVLFEIFFYLP